jgi:hypothetical protein
MLKRTRLVTDFPCTLLGLLIVEKNSEMNKNISKRKIEHFDRGTARL